MRSIASTHRASAGAGAAQTSPILGAHRGHDLVTTHREEPLGLELQDVASLGRRQRWQRDAFRAEQLQIDGDRDPLRSAQHWTERRDRVLGMLGIERHFE